MGIEYDNKSGLILNSMKNFQKPPKKATSEMLERNVSHQLSVGLVSTMFLFLSSEFLNN